MRPLSRFRLTETALSDRSATQGAGATSLSLLEAGPSDQTKMQAFPTGQNNSHSKKPRFGKLTINTGCSAKEEPPVETRMLGLSFVSFEESRARRKAHASQDGIAKAVKPPPANRLTIFRSVGRYAVRQNETNGPASARVTESPQGIEAMKIPLSDRVSGLRPAPVDANQEVSPHDRAIPIGLSFFSPSTVQSPSSSDIHHGQGASTPVILITPAEEHFPSTARQRRPSSSVYSRYTTCAPKSANSKAPPVPPLPLSVDTKYRKVLLSRKLSSTSAATTFEEDVTPASSRIAPDSSTSENHRRCPSMRSAGLPTPRRSRGWWNIITSPFSARSTGGFFQRSPSLREEHMRILADVQEMASCNSHVGVVFTNRASGDYEVRSAPATISYGTFGGIDRSVPTRSETAPGVLDLNTSDFSIYKIPSQGEAAAYYDPKRHFPSIYLESKDMVSSPNDELRGWSPSNSIFMPDRDHKHIGDKMSAINSIDGVDVKSSREEATNQEPGTFSDEVAKEKTSLLPSKRAVFTTPTPEELNIAGFSVKQNKRNFTQTTTDSIMSPMSATPVVQDAHLGRFVGPHSSYGEQRRVNVEATPNSTGPIAPAAHQEDRRGDRSSLHSKWTSIHVYHHRENSHGLGISNPRQELFPPPQPLCDKLRLGTDKFGQPTIRSTEAKEPRRSWYRRYFWYLATAIGLLLVILIVLLAVLVPRRQVDTGTSVETSWLNLTGFPAVTIGVTNLMQTQITDDQSSCVAPSSLWSCAMPEQDRTIAPAFRFEIIFRNGTLPSNETAILRTRHTTGGTPQSLMRKSLWSDSQLDPSPAPPSKEDQEFFGRTTDNSSQPYDGEETPFYISFLDSTGLSAPSSQALEKRNEDYQYPYPSKSRASSPARLSITSILAPEPSKATPTLTSSSGPTSSPASATSSSGQIPVPPPAILPNGSPLPQLLYPLVRSQPLRLYNRNQPSEHYGFCTYFDRSIYITNATSGSPNGTAIRTNVALKDASGVCTFSQTRFKVAIWTRRGSINVTESITASSTLNQTFPYPVTFTVDRHGGSEQRKGVYCYGIDEDGKVMKDGKMWVEEERGRNLVDPGTVPGMQKLRRRGNKESNVKGIDGGTGGCECQWQG